MSHFFCVFIQRLDSADEKELDRYTVCGDEEDFDPSEVKGKVEGMPVVYERKGDQLTAFLPRQSALYPEGDSTFWLGLYVDGYAISNLLLLASILMKLQMKRVFT